MGVTTGTALVPAHGSGAIPSYVVTPPSGSGPGILLLHETFGITDYIRRRAERLARLGYVTVVPEVFWRFGRGIEIDEAADDADERGEEYRRRLDLAVAVDDAVTVFEHLRSMPSVFRRSGVLGFSLGAGIAFGVASHAGPGAAVCYYGADIGGQLHRVSDIRCPVLLHWGADDDVSEQTRNAVVHELANHTTVESHVYPDASRSFDNDRSPTFSRPDQAAEAWQRTEDFLARALPVAHH